LLKGLNSTAAGSEVDRHIGLEDGERDVVVCRVQDEAAVVDAVAIGQHGP
jgi:hypothetical protein